MISEDDMSAVSSVLAEQAEQYGCEAWHRTDNDFLCGFFDGLQDATYIARAIIEAQREVRSADEYKDLRRNICTCTSTGYHQSSNFLKGVQRGRESGGVIAADILDALAPENWVKAAKEE